MLTPDILFDSYRDITPAFLQSQGVTLLLTDLDYTLAPKAVRRPDDTLRQWINGLKDAGITVMIVSNNRSGVRVTEFCGDLDIGYQGHAGKPSPKGLRAAMERTGTDPAHTAMLGDKLLTDMLAAHRAGVRAWMVEPLAMAAVAAGADGLMVEVHNDPAHAKCDGAQSLTPEMFDALMARVRGAAGFFGKQLNEI